MLVLSRRKNEGILIGDCIEVVLLEIKGNRIRLGIKAPNDIEINRFGGPGEANDAEQLLREWEVEVTDVDVDAGKTDVA